MGETDATFPNIDDNVATNVRAFRERSGLSQEELAQRMSERGFGFSQATIWKIESGQRPVKISEAVALSEALDLPRWLDLTAEPDMTRHYADLTLANRVTHQAYAALKEAAAVYLRAQVDLSFVAREAQIAGVPVHEAHTSWLDVPAEKVIIEARVESADEDEIRMRQTEEVNSVMAALREHGYAPPRPEDWVDGGFGDGDGDESATSRIDNVVNNDTADDATQES